MEGQLCRDMYGGRTTSKHPVLLRQHASRTTCVNLPCCRLCNTRVDGDGEAELVQPQPYVRVHFVVQGGVGKQRL